MGAELAIIIPLIIFVITAIGGGFIMAVRLAVYFARSREAQESTAKSNGEINATLKTYIATTNTRLNDHGERISVLEDRTGIVRR